VFGSPRFSARKAAATALFAARPVDHLHAHRQQLFLFDHDGDRAREHVAAASRAGVHDQLPRSASA